MARTFDITWEVDDGYAGKSRPQTSTIDLEDVQDFEEASDIRDHIRDVIQDDFEQKISWCSDGVDELVAEIQQAIEEEAEELKEQSNG